VHIVDRFIDVISSDHTIFAPGFTVFVSQLRIDFQETAVFGLKVVFWRETSRFGYWLYPRLDVVDMNVTGYKLRFFHTFRRVDGLVDDGFIGMSVGVGHVAMR
jgi:hypothetical protein